MNTYWRSDDRSCLETLGSKAPTDRAANEEDHETSAVPGREVVSAPDELRSMSRSSWFSSVTPELQQELRKLSHRDNVTNFSYIAGDWGVIASAIAVTYLSDGNPAVYAIAVILIGSRQRALMNLFHEASHHKLFRSRRLNDGVAHALLGFPLLSSLHSYRKTHRDHHRWLWSQDRDPKRARYEQLGLISPERLRFVLRHIFGPLLLRHVPHNLRAVFNSDPQAKLAGSVAISVVVLGIFAATHLIGAFVLCWVVPYLTSFQVIRYWAEMAEHAGLDNASQPMLATRNWTSGPVTRWLIASHSDDMYHLAHHLYPAIPHFHLAQAHALLISIPLYRNAHHCDGFMFPRSNHAPTVIEDIVGSRHRAPADQTVVLGDSHAHESALSCI